MSNKQETKELSSIDIILQNLKNDPEYYNHGMTNEMWMQENQRSD